MQNLSQYKRLVEKKFQRGLSQEWKHRDYIYLSDEIYDCSKIRVSTDTLKRIFGKKRTNNDYQPQTETIYALEIYVNEIRQKKAVHFDFLKSRLFYFLIGALVTFTIMSITSINKGRQETYSNKKAYASVKLKTPIKTLPVTANFELSLPEEFDLYKLYFGNGQSIKLKPGDSRFSHYYGTPGFYRVQVKNDGELVSNIEQVYLPSNGWYLINEISDGKTVGFEYPISTQQNNYFHTPDTDSPDLESLEKDIIKTRFVNYQPFPKTEESFDLSFDLINTKDSLSIEKDCSKVGIKLVGTHSNVFQSFAPPGCSYWLNCNYAGNYVLGKRMDLSKFEMDLSRWTNFRFHVEGQQMDIYVDGEALYTTQLKKKVGQILGIEFQFKGIGSLDNIEIKNSDGKSVLVDNFDVLHDRMIAKGN